MKPTLFPSSGLTRGRRVSAGLRWVLLTLAAGGSALQAQVTILGVSAETDVFFTRADPLTPLASATDSTEGTAAVEASSLLTLPDYTSPSGSPLDTGWQPATARAYQSELGFNSTLVKGAFANGEAVNRLDAITTWTVSGMFESVLFQVPHELTLDYLIFPGEVGLSSFASAGSRAGFSVEIKAGPIFSQDIVFAEHVEIARAMGALTPTLTVGPTFAGAGITSGVINRDFMNYSHVATQPFTGATSLGYFLPGVVFEVTYTMHAWLQVPGYEVAGFASIADPFALTSDPAAYLAEVFPGLDFPGFTITATPAAVPEPATWALLTGTAALALAGARRWRRRGCGRRDAVGRGRAAPGLVVAAGLVLLTMPRGSAQPIATEAIVDYYAPRLTVLGLEGIGEARDPVRASLSLGGTPVVGSTLNTAVVWGDVDASTGVMRVLARAPLTPQVAWSGQVQVADIIEGRGLTVAGPAGTTAMLTFRLLVDGTFANSPGETLGASKNLASAELRATPWFGTPLDLLAADGDLTASFSYSQRTDAFSQTFNTSTWAGTFGTAVVTEEQAHSTAAELELRFPVVVGERFDLRVILGAEVFGVGNWTAESDLTHSAYLSLGLPAGFTLESANDVLLSVTPVPEPATWAVCAGVAALGAALWRRRCGRHQGGCGRRSAR